MKKNIVFTLIIFISLSSCASVNSMDDFYAKYEKEATIIPIPGFLVNIAAKNTNLEVLKYLKSARFFLMKNVKENKQSRIIKDFSSSLRGDGLNNLIKLKSGSKNLNVSTLESGNHVKKMIMGINGFQNIIIIDSKVNVEKQELQKALEKLSEQDIEDIANLLGK